MKNKLLLFVLLSIGYSNIHFTYNGNFSHFYAIRNSNSKVLNIPFRMLEFNSTLQFGNNFEIKSLLSSEYHNTNDDYFDYKNINNEVRELYATYYFNLGEISLGKRLFTLGSVDENSPIDHFNPYNYYYLLIGGKDKKIGINAVSFDFYIGDNYILSGAYSPEHNKNYYPQNDSEYSLSLPTNPVWYEFLENKGSDHESFLSLQRSTTNNELTLSYLRAFDRVFALSGFTMHEYTGFCDQDKIDYIELTNELAGFPLLEVCTLGDILDPDGDEDPTNPDKWFSYRLTETLNLGLVQLFNDFTIRADLAYFHSFDRYNKKDYSYLRSSLDFEKDANIEDPDPFGDWYGVFHDGINIDGIDGEEEFIAPLEEDIKYYQFTFQLELPLPQDWQVNMQYFQYKLDSYKINSYTFSDVVINIPLAEPINLQEVINEDGDFFIPGFGSSMATLTERSVLFGIEKYLLDNSLKTTCTSFFDLDKGDGKLISLEIEYEISDNINLIFGSTKIIGDQSVESTSFIDPGYTFNIMEDFSHNRIQLNYYF
tara:strand:- start:790 stop:2406 length:1617 start_codon:yes stop_codon:yes gene_type:complete